MSQWFKNVRQEFIAAQLRQFGQLQRGDLVRQFGISIPQAVVDIREFLSADPPNVVYDVNAKAYVLTEAADAAQGKAEQLK